MFAHPQWNYAKETNVEKQTCKFKYCYILGHILCSHLKSKFLSCQKPCWSPTTKLTKDLLNSFAGSAHQTESYKNSDSNYLFIQAESKFTCLNLNKVKSAQLACKSFPPLNKILRASVFSITLSIYLPKNYEKNVQSPEF